MAKNEEKWAIWHAGCAGAGCIIATKYLRDVVVVIKINWLQRAIYYCPFVFAPRLFGQINNAFHHSCFDSFFSHDMFCRSGLPYAKGTSTRLIRLISIGGGVLFLGGAFYLFYFNGLAFLCCSEAGCVPILCASLKEKEVGSLYRDCNSYYIVLICCFLSIFWCVWFVFYFHNNLIFKLFLSLICFILNFYAFNGINDY